MFTFGRDQEIKTALRRHGGADSAGQVVDIVNAIHDLQENKCALEDVESVIRLAREGATSGSQQELGCLNCKATTRPLVRCGQSWQSTLPRK
jgi:hypothetical protein